MKKYFKKSLLIAVLVVALLAVTVSVAFASGGTYHRVSYGETLFSIGRYYGVNPYAIADANDLYNPNHIYAGQVLYIPSYHHYDGCNYNCDGYQDGYYDGYYDGCYDCTDYYDGYAPNHHVVAYGETLTSIAYYYGISPWALAQANRIYNLNRIYAGQVLYIPSAGYY